MHSRIMLKLCSAFLYFSPCSFGQTLEFTENKGQWHTDVLYMGRLSSGALFLLNDGYKVLQYQPAAYAGAVNSASGHGFLNDKHTAEAQVIASEQTVKAHAYAVKFGGAFLQPEISPDKKLPGYSNYFIGDDASKWAGGVNSYSLIQYRSIYQGVDARFFSDNGFVKYEWIVAPGGAVGEIKLIYDGVESIKVEKGELVIKTSVGETREKAPYSYQLSEAGRQQIPCHFVVKGNTVSFKLSGYDPTKTLIIDPTFVFSTFAGSVSDNWGYTATYDVEGNAYGGGIVIGNNYPVTTGAFQTSFGGGTSSTEGATGFDINIIKLDPLGRTRIFSTFLGGNSNEQPHSLVVDPSGNLVVAGRTLSANYPTRGAGNIGTGGQWDIIVTKFNAAGTNIIGSVRIGGSGDDGVNVRHKFPATAPSFTDRNYGDDARSEVITDALGNVYLASSTRSTNFPVTPNNVQGSLRGAQDALVLKLNANLTNLEYATYLGGSAHDAAYVLIVDGAGSVMVAGGTMSDDFPGVKTGTVGPAFAGGTLDGFVAHIGPTGHALQEVAYIGTSGNDQLYGIQRDKNGFVYVMGTSTGNFPVRNATFSQNGGKQFIAKMQPDLSAYIYSTVFGTNETNPNLSPTAFLVDNCENVYVSGWGGDIIQNPPYPISSTTGLTVTPDAIKATTDGKDFYFFVLEKDAVSQLYGSFFGQASGSISHDHVDGGTSRFDQNGIIYQGMCANCDGGQFPTTPGTVSPSNPSSRCNLAIAKVDFELSGVRTGVQSFIDGIRRDSSFCVPATIDFVDSIAVGKRFEWSFGDGSPGEVSDTPIIRHTFAREGNYQVRLIAIDEEKCIPRDTAFINIRVRIDKVPLNADAIGLPPCTDLNYQFNNRSTPFPGKPFKDSSFIWLFGDNSAPLKAGLAPVTHRYPGPGTYNVRLVLADTNYCNAPDTFSFTVRVNPNVSARFEGERSGCAPLRVNFNNTSLGGVNFQWDFGNGQTSSEMNPAVIFQQPGNYRVKMTANDPNTCNIFDSSFFTVTVSGSPAGGFNYAPRPSLENIPTSFTNSSVNAIEYKWFFGDGDSLVTIRRDTIVRHQYPRTDTYNCCLIATNEFGCTDTVCTVIPAQVTPLIDVVSAFTPNNDGTNDKAIVFGFGVTNMTFRIFNRWGEMVFETNNFKQGWDGFYKGKPQPMDAYGYTLTATLIDGTDVKRSGSITLVR